MRSYLIGERQNSKTWRPPFWPGVSGEKYWRLMLKLRAFRDEQSQAKLRRLGIEVSECLSVNLLPPDPQTVPWDAEKAREVAGFWLPRFHRRLLYLAGGRVAAAFGVRRGPLRGSFGKSSMVGGSRIIIIPHPSGLNHFWNDRGDVVDLQNVLTETLARGETCRD